MFVWKAKLSQREEKSKVELLDFSSAGCNRRAIGLVPFPGEESKRQIVDAVNLKYKSVFISVEGRRTTCCFKVISPTGKARGAILVFRGRVLGSIFGCKSMSGQLLGPEAMKRSVDELSDPHAIVDTYILPERLALAAGSLFHGDVYNQPSNRSAEGTFEMTYSHLVKSQMPGCIVVRDGFDAHGFVYLFGGVVEGVFSFKRGWLDCRYEEGLKMIAGLAQPSVSASCLKARNTDEVNALTFSLTGLDGIGAGDRSHCRSMFSRAAGSHLLLPCDSV